MRIGTSVVQLEFHLVTVLLCFLLMTQDIGKDTPHPCLGFSMRTRGQDIHALCSKQRKGNGWQVSCRQWYSRDR